MAVTPSYGSLRFKIFNLCSPGVNPDANFIVCVTVSIDITSSFGKSASSTNIEK